MARTTLESIQHAIEVNSSLAIPIARENLARPTCLALLTGPVNLVHILVSSLRGFRADPDHQPWRQEIIPGLAMLAFEVATDHAQADLQRRGEPRQRCPGQTLQHRRPGLVPGREQRSQPG